MAKVIYTAAVDLGFDLRKYMPELKAVDIEKTGQTHYYVQIAVQSSDNNVETGSDYPVFVSNENPNVETGPTYVNDKGKIVPARITAVRKPRMRRPGSCSSSTGSIARAGSTRPEWTSPGCSPRPMTASMRCSCMSGLRPSRSAQSSRARARPTSRWS